MGGLQEDQALGGLDAMGVGVLLAIVACYALASRSPRWLLGLALACAAGAIYGFMQHAWPFWFFELICGAAVAARWMNVRR